MQILLVSEYDSEVLLEDDISPVAIHNELTDRAIEIEVSVDEVCEWLSTQQQSLVVAEDYGDTISIVKQGFDTFPTMFVDYDSIYDTDDLYNQVVECPDEMPEIDMDIGANPYDPPKAPNNRNCYEKLRRWVESHPIQWHKLTYAEIAAQVKMSIGPVQKHLSACVISAKYVKSVDEFKQKRRASRGYKQVKSKPNPSIAKIYEWLRQNYNRWQSMTFEEISNESGISNGAVQNNLAKLLLAEGFISDMSEYKQIRKECRGYKGKMNAPMQLVDVI